MCSKVRRLQTYFVQYFNAKIPDAFSFNNMTNEIAYLDFSDSGQINEYFLSIKEPILTVNIKENKVISIDIISTNNSITTKNNMIFSFLKIEYKVNLFPAYNDIGNNTNKFLGFDEPINLNLEKLFFGPDIKINFTSKMEGIDILVKKVNIFNCKAGILE